MKKLKLLLALPLLTFTLSGCDKDSNHAKTVSSTYNYVHVSFTEKCMHDRVISYYIYSRNDVAHIQTEHYGWIIISNNYLLYNTEACPICGYVEYK